MSVIMSIFSVALGFSAFFCVIVVWLNISGVFKYYFGKGVTLYDSEKGGKRTAILMLVLTAIFIIYPTARYIAIQPEGTYCYYAEVSYHDKEYILPAEIYLRNSGYLSTPETYYNIKRAYWPNGGYLSFDEYDNRVYFDETRTFYNIDDHDWDVRLINSRASHPRITEEFQPKPIPFLEYFLALNTLIYALAIFYFLRKNKLQSLMEEGETSDLS